MWEIDLLVLDLDLFALSLLDECPVDEMEEFSQLLVIIKFSEVVVLVEVKQWEFGHLSLHQKVQLRTDAAVRVYVHLCHQLEQVLQWEHELYSLFKRHADRVELRYEQVHQFENPRVVDKRDLDWLWLDLEHIQTEGEPFSRSILLDEEYPPEHILLLHELVQLL